MTGLVVSTKKSLSKKGFVGDLKSLLVGNLENVGFEQSALCDSALIAPKNSAASSSHYKNYLTIYVDGYFVENLGADKTSSEWFLEYYLASGLEEVLSLNGSFNILIVDQQTQEVTLVTDKYGTRPLYYSVNENELIVSYRSSQVNLLEGREYELNLKLVANQLSYGRIWHRNETFFTGVIIVPKACIIAWNSISGVHERSYLEPAQTLLESDGKPEELAEIFKEVVNDFGKVPNLGLSLSGGLDSRILLAAGFKGDTFTWGYQAENDEIVLAQRCAHENGNNWHFLRTDPEMFLDLDGSGELIRDGLDLSVQAYTLACYPQVVNEGINGLMTGLALDFTMGGSYHPKGSNLSISEIQNYVFEKVEVFDQKERDRLFKCSELHQHVSDIKNEISRDIEAECETKDRNEVIHEFFMEQRVRRWIFQRQAWQRTYCEDYIPTFDDRIIDYLARFSLEDRAQHNIYQQVLLSLSKTLASIPYQGTNMPATVPTKYWAQATKIESEKERLYRNIFHDSDGEVFVPYNRYYSNFDEWLRTNNKWKAEAYSLLLSDDSRILELLDKTVVQEILDKQSDGSKTNYGKIILLMSLEKTLRCFF